MQMGIVHPTSIRGAKSLEGRIHESGNQRGRSGRLSLLPFLTPSDPLGAFVFLVSPTLGSMALEVLVPRRTCFYQETHEESLVQSKL